MSAGADLGPVVKAARAGNEHAFGVLYTAVQPGLLRYLRALVGQDAEDIASDTWLEVARDIRWYTAGGPGFAGWVAGLARRRAMEHRRRADRQPYQMAPELFTDVPGGRDTEAEAVAAVATDHAVALIASLPPDQAEAVLLRVLLGLSAEAAGRVLGKRPGAVRTAAHRGLRRLAAHLESDATGIVPPRSAADSTPRPSVARSATAAPKVVR